MNQKKIYLLFVSVLLTGHSYAQTKPSLLNDRLEDGFTRSLQGTHDMALPAWGPYSNRFNGISHVPQQNDGMRFDVIVQPSFYLRNGIGLGNTQRESGYHPWQATPDLSYFSYRYELEWKDRVYCDVSFSKLDENSRLIRAQFVNRTGNNRSVALNIFSSVMFPYSKRVKAVLPAGVNWVEASKYVSLTDSFKMSNYNLVYNGQLRGQANDDNAVSHNGILFSKNVGERLVYKLPNPRGLRSGVLAIRYHTGNGARDTKLKVIVNGKGTKDLAFKGSKDYTLAMLDLDDLAGDVGVDLLSVGGPPVFFDGFALLKKEEVTSLRFEFERLNEKPKQLATDISNAAIFKYDDIKEFYGLVWSDKAADRRSILDDNPDEALGKFDNLVKSGSARLNTGHITGNNKGWFENIFSAPIVVEPGQKVSRYAVVVSGSSEAEVAAKLRVLNTKWSEVEKISDAAQAKAINTSYNKAGEPYQFSQQLMAATALTNLIYPVFAGNQYFKHTTPGKRWSSFYTWDSGFIGLGYTELSLQRAVESLNAYTMDSTEQSAFLEHGTPLPTQAYLFNTLWNRTQNIEYLKYFYPRLKRYYDFLGGAENSPTRRLRSGLIQTWNIFYNSGGWDDYSPQVYTHKEKLEDVVAPAINTSHQIRFAKMLRQAAWQLGYKEDMAQYDTEIAAYSKALQQNAWDEPSGYFGYVKHTAKGDPVEILKYPTGVNYNMGLDGCSPLIAGICTPVQQQKILSHLFTKGQLWSDQGITAIDQTAPYYSKVGYWNGRVWMPHQWFFWKTMFDLNEPEKAVQIAQKALEVWKRETDDTYNCWENFGVEGGNGGGWHQFGALSSPVLNWFNALYRPGTITCGFNVWFTKQKFAAGNDGYTGEFKLFADGDNKGAAMLICLSDKYQYEAKCNGKMIPLKKICQGTYTLQVMPQPSDVYTLSVVKKRKLK